MNSYLIAHKVRGKLAFDVAEKMVCHVCQGEVISSISVGEIGNILTPKPCSFCDSTGHWWILSTVGHRAYPFWSRNLDELCSFPDVGSVVLPLREMVGTDEPPEDLRDFYSIHDQQVKGRASVPGPNDNLTLEDLGL
jgi:hypothetical protein